MCLATGAPAFAGVIYTDGPTSGSYGALFIDGPGGLTGQTVSDEFVATNSGSAASLDFGEWVITGTPTSVCWALGTSAFASDVSSGCTAQVGFTLFASNGIDVYNVEVDGLSGSLTAGNTYYLTLSGANDTMGSYLDQWDENNGAATCFYAFDGVDQGECAAGGEAFTLNSGTAPEPGSMMLFGSGLLGLAGVLRRKLIR